MELSPVPSGINDIAQQVFIKVYFSIKSFEGRSSLYTWLHRITVNKCYEFLRKKRLTASLDTNLESEDDPVAPSFPPTRARNRTRSWFRGSFSTNCCYASPNRTGTCC